MSAWTEAQRVSIRKWMGYGNVFQQADPRLELAMTAVLAVVDGGTRPDSSAQLAILGYLAFLDGSTIPAAAGTVEAQWQALLFQFQIGEADGETKLDAIRALAGVFKVGRMYVRLICYSLGFKRPLYDIFTGRSFEREGSDNIREPYDW